jgi:uracil-DNA glycosylase family 4
MTMTQGLLCHDYGIRGYGNPSSGVVVVGIGPGRDEAERTKRPFTGTSGRLLDALLKHAGWSRDKIYATNVVCWFNNSPSPAEIEECRPRFVKELRDLSPKLIIAAGAIASEALLGTKRRPGQRGAVLWSDYWNAYVLDTHHPSFALQSQSMNAVQDIIRDLSKIEMVLGWPPRAEHTKVRYSLVNSLEEAQQVLDSLPTSGESVSLDIETSNPDDENIDAYSDQLLCFSVSWWSSLGKYERTIVFPTHIFPLCVRDGTHVRSWDASGRCPSCDLPRKALIFPANIRWLFQYGQADIPALHIYLGNGPTLHDDTMLMSVCVDERPRTEGQKGTTGQHGLKPNAREWLGAGWYNDPVKPFYKGKLNQVPPDDIYAYNAKDAAYTRRLPAVFLPRMAADGTDGLYRNLLIPATQTFIQMQMRGIKINWDTLQELACGKEGWFMRYFDTYKELQLEAADIGWPSTDINLNSNPQLAKFFYQIIGLDITKYTKGGKPAVDKETLDLMDHPFAAKLRAYRTLDTMVDYLMQVYAHLKWDGLIHPQAYVSTTRTGRTSYRNPSLQNFPKDYTVGADYARFRETIEPHNTDTHELLESDYGQIEVWLGWAYSRDPVLLEHLESGDVHTRTAEGAFNTKRELHSPEEWTEYRQRAKHIRFGIQYGEGAKGLTRQPPIGIGGTVAAAQKYIDNYKRTYPTYTQWMLDIQREALTKGFLRTPDGRVMRFPIVMDHKQLRQSVNFPIQNTASAYNLKSMIALEHPNFNQQLRAMNSWVILNIHDCLVIESDRRYRTEVAALVREVMEAPKFDGFPSIKVDIKVGPNLGKMEKLK